jgi:hypothetical protein
MKQIQGICVYGTGLLGIILVNHKIRQRTFLSVELAERGLLIRQPLQVEQQWLPPALPTLSTYKYKNLLLFNLVWQLLDQEREVESGVVLIQQDLRQQITAVGDPLGQLHIYDLVSHFTMEAQ